MNNEPVNPVLPCDCEICGAPGAKEVGSAYVCKDCEDQLSTCDRCDSKELPEMMRSGLCQNCADDMFSRYRK